MYKDASKLKLRVSTNVGELSVEQLWDLSPQDLDEIAVRLEEEYKSSGKKSFLVAKSKKDKVTKLKFDIVVDVLTSKVEEAKDSLTALEKKTYNQKILALIADKKDDALKEMSAEELEALLKE